MNSQDKLIDAVYEMHKRILEYEKDISELKTLIAKRLNDDFDKSILNAMEDAYRIPEEDPTNTV